MLTRRAVVAGIAAVALAPVPTLATPAGQHFRHFFPPVRVTYDPAPYIEMHEIIAASDWRYQSFPEAEGDMRGIVWHLPTGFAFYTLPDDGPPPDPMLDYHKARCLFAEGESLAAGYGRRRAIGRAAAWVARGMETVDSGAFYLPRGFDAVDVIERPAPPFIVSRAPIGFMLDGPRPLAAKLDGNRRT